MPAFSVAGNDIILELIEEEKLPRPPLNKSR